jgi:hypothetical protein
MVPAGVTISTVADPLDGCEGSALAVPEARAPASVSPPATAANRSDVRSLLFMHVLQWTFD